MRELRTLVRLQVQRPEHPLRRLHRNRDALHLRGLEIVEEKQ